MKRANGTGTIVRNKQRKRYLVYAPAIQKDGKRQTIYLGSFKTKLEAQICLDGYLRQPLGERFKLTFEQVYEEYKKSSHFKKLGEKSQSGYEVAYNHCTELNRCRFSDLRTSHFQSIIDDMATKGMSSSSVEKVRNLFSQLSKYALKEDIIIKNYAEFIEIPTIERKKEPRALSKFEIERIRKEADEGDETAQIIMYMLYSGWRISEMLELTKDKYNSEDKYFIGGKKTKNGKNRIVPVNPRVQWIVDKFLERDGQTVFCRPDGQPMDDKYFRRYKFNKFIDRMNLDEEITPHYTRHTFATRLKENGADEFYRKCLLGHSHETVTDKVYTHANIEKLREAVLLFDEPKKTEDDKNKPTKSKEAI
ncbi:MAG: tyrosine-type recombinase/integrase [Acutalibacteraceae bacterium]